MDADRRAGVIMLLGLTSGVGLFLLMGQFGYTGPLRWAALALGVAVPSGIIGHFQDREPPGAD
ncbi:hypothetical protein ACFR9U_12245 [Halorientalis brevis]|uniref:DUF2892 domain-containing protein n=1 Tax=Halorientalis brevis TaxID=1126241 RepID=A0ABD6CEW8_9EURY|nr:hypothetical protein [Halorientalis brevis]